MEFINNIKNNIKSVLQITDKIKWMDIDKIIIDPELEGIFVQKENEISNICKNIMERGFDPAHPIILAYSKEHPEFNNINVDGMTRYKASLRAGITKVAIIYKEFADRAELLKFVYEQQLLRRNLTESEIFNSWQAMNKLTNENGKKAKSDSEIAEELQISRRQVSKMKEVEKKAPPEVLDRIKSGEITVNKAYTQIKQQEAKTEKTEPPEPKEDDEILFPEEFAKGWSAGFSFGLEYVYESLHYGKTVDELYAEFTEMKAGKISLESLKETLDALKESYEHKQTE